MCTQCVLTSCASLSRIVNDTQIPASLDTSNGLRAYYNIENTIHDQTLTAHYHPLSDAEARSALQSAAPALRHDVDPVFRLIDILIVGVDVQHIVHVQQSRTDGADSYYWPSDSRELQQCVVVRGATSK